MTDRSEFKATDFAISAEDAKDLSGISLMPADLRAELLSRLAEKHGTAWLVGLFAQFVGLANSVMASGREAMEDILMIDGEMHPYSAEKVNLPTIFGALQGVILADGIKQRPLCHGCAFRLGTPANQSPSTTADVTWCLSGDDGFMCHTEFDKQGKPKRKCKGFAQALKRRD